MRVPIRKKFFSQLNYTTILIFVSTNVLVHMKYPAQIMDLELLNEYNLMKVCNWECLQNVAIEHHYSNANSILITYCNLRKIQRGLKRILAVKLSSVQFIGISSDIPIFCIPSLILGIISAGHAFVYLSTELQDLLLRDTYLNIDYVIVPKNSCRIIGGRIIKRFIMHKQSLILKKVSRKSVGNQQRINVHNIYNTNCFAYAVTTSASTGSPSIVRVTHASIVPNILDLKKIFKLRSCDKVVQLTPLTFDPSIIEIFLSMSCGATLLTVSDELRNDPSELSSVLEKNRATFLSSTPSILLHRWSASRLKSSLLRKNSELRILLLGGEPFPSSQTLLKMKHPENQTRLFNIYGITEVSCWASIDEIYFNADDKTIINYNNLGTVLSNTIFQVRSEIDDNVISEGEGILHIGSNTRICVIDNENINHLHLPMFRNTGDLVKIDLNGEIRLIGRRDSCVKRFGAKLYLNNLERHIKRLDFVEDCHAIFIQQSSALHLFFTAIYNKQQLPNDEEKKIMRQIWDHVRLLPILMHPDYIHYLDGFEITEHGKVCTKVLRKMSVIKESNSDFGVLFESIWKSHLPSDDKLSRFVDTGGTSIMALEILGKLTDNVENVFPDLVGMLLENRTLDECRNYVVQQHKRINMISNASNRHHACVNAKVAELDQNYIELQNLCQWQKCRGKTIDYQFTRTDRHQIIIDHNFRRTSDSFKSIKLLGIHNLGKCIDASPIVFKYPSDDEVFVSVGSHSGMICTIQISDNHYWKVQLPDRIEAAISIVDDFKGIVGCHDGFIYCVHLKTGKIYWKFRTGNIVKCLARICSRRRNIFVGSYDHYIYCIDIKSGSLIWKQSAASICATPLIHDETSSVIFASLDGNCASLDQLTGEFRWKVLLTNPIFSSPTFMNNNHIVIIADVNGNITACETDSGHEMWNIKIREYIFADLATISNDTWNLLDSLIITTKSGNIYKYDFDEMKSHNPTLSYKINCDSSIFASPWVEKTLLIIALENGELRTFNLNDGSLGASFKLGGECFSSPVLYQNFIFVGCRDDNLYILTTE